MPIVFNGSSANVYQEYEEEVEILRRNLSILEPCDWRRLERLERYLKDYRTFDYESIKEEA